MSASLVGSEMCIRDRLQRFERPRPSATGTAARLACGDCQRPLPRRLRAVSYTHLTLPTICSV
eukprot:2442117-Alexandrium_andersonii.AAC.1